ncbi:SMP-30/gluconolactonase/LRE family protein [Oceaniglobus trochenteri]|uniref:SMP-30/gluconolactonase/LRE family protein n=1 Tax=Oceaniglobus trochenteri TaxID=2763260 RepID=UPI001D001595|nr:SMP-30/gluconolactonase/LRE family protein [Oceaniglobus trochenteri]
MNISVFDPTPCTLGEGPLWHPGLNCLFWFDILGKKLFQNRDGQTRQWQFDEYVSAAGWLDDENLLIASATRLFRFNLETAAQETICALDADNPDTRSNDGRADPYGGFWIGTMRVDAGQDGGAIYRFYKGEVRKLFDPITISNAISFAPDGKTACFTDTKTQVVHRVALDADGWPAGEPEVHVDLRETELRPDGAVFDAAGNLWIAFFGAARVGCYGPDGQEKAHFPLPAAQITCPAFGGPDMTTLFCTSAAVNDDGPAAGQTFAIETDVKGQAEHQVKL